MDGAYLDYNATAPVRAGVLARMQAVLAQAGNPSSVHGRGRLARAAVERSRDALAAALGAPSAGVIFTSGASEANALALTGLGPGRVVACAVEHPSVLAHAARIVPVDKTGTVDLAALDAVLADEGAGAVVAVMLANNETGLISPVAEVAALARGHGAWLHCDAAQALGKVAVDLAALGADSLSVSAHKMGGPQGAGALVLADPDAPLRPLIAGGGQERFRRAGTENVAAIAGFAAALEPDLAAEAARIGLLRDRMEEAVLGAVADAVVIGRGHGRLPNTSAIALPGVPAERAVMMLDLDGVMVSAGSACSSGKIGKSHVLDAMGLGETAGETIRISLGWASEERDVERFLGAFARLARSRRKAA